MMAFRLCLALGYPHPDVLLETLTARQWADWIAFSRIESWGDTRADLRSAIVGAGVLNAWRGKGDKPIEVWQLMPYEEKPEPTPAQLKTKMQDMLYGASRKAQH